MQGYSEETFEYLDHDFLVEYSFWQGEYEVTLVEEIMPIEWLVDENREVFLEEVGRAFIRRCKEESASLEASRRYDQMVADGKIKPGSFLF